MGGRDYSPNKNNIPGPGSYQPDESMIKHRNPNIYFSNSPSRSFSGSPHRDNDIGPG